MIARILLAAVTGSLLVAGSGGPSWAKEYNQRPFLEPGKQVKVQRTLVRGRVQGAEQGESEGGAAGGGATKDIAKTSCGSFQMGNVKTTGRPGERAPRENIVVARDVINVAKGCSR